MAAEQVPDEHGRVDPRSILAVVDVDAPSEGLIGQVRHLVSGQHAEVVRYVGLYRE